MSLALLHEVPAGALETLLNEQKQRLFKRVDLGKHLSIEKIRDNFKEFLSHCTHTRSEIEGSSLTSTFGRAKNPHDIFINLDGSIKMVVRSKKPKEVALVKWLAKKGIKKT